LYVTTPEANDSRLTRLSAKDLRPDVSIRPGFALMAITLGFARLPTLLMALPILPNAQSNDYCPTEVLEASELAGNVG
jgi:hypothetical protein